MVKVIASTYLEWKYILIIIRRSC